MLASLLPGVRELRAPLAAGYIWLLTIWVASYKVIPQSLADARDTVFAPFLALGGALSALGAGIAISFVAYVAGSLSTGFIGPGLERRGSDLSEKGHDSLTILVQEAVRTTAEELREVAGRPLMATGNASYWGKALGVGAGHAYRRAEEEWARESAEHFYVDGEWLDLVEVDRDEAVRSSTENDKLAPAGSRDDQESEPESLDDDFMEPLSDTEVNGLIEEGELPGIKEYFEQTNGNVTSSWRGWTVTKETRGRLLQLQESKPEEGKDFLFERQLTRSLCSEVERELGLIANRLIGKEKELFAEFDRLRSEASFRLAIVPPVVAFSLVGVARGVLTVPMGLLAVGGSLVVLTTMIAVAYLVFRQAMRMRQEAGDLLVDTLLAGERVQAPALEKFQRRAANVSARSESRGMEKSSSAHKSGP